MKKWRKKVQKFFARPGVLKWTIVLVTLIIVVGAIKALLWTIYTKDKPAFVPENVRQDIQGAIKEGGEAIKKISEPIGSAIVDAGYVRDCGCNTITDDGRDDITANWQTYTDPATGISMKYPEGWQAFEGEEGVFSFGPSEDSYDGITVFYTKNFDSINSYWTDYIKDWDAEISEPKYLTLGGRSVVFYKQKDGMREAHYLVNFNGFIFDFMPGGEGYRYVEKILDTIH